MRITPAPFIRAVLAVAVLAIGQAKDAWAKSESSTPQEVFDGMAKNFQAQKAKGMHVRYQFDLTGPNGGDWFIDVNDGKFKMARGKIDHPSVTLITSDKDWVALSNGELGGTWAFMSGRLKIHGDHALAKRLGEMFP